jgi:hypothetical protein
LLLIEQSITSARRSQTGRIETHGSPDSRVLANFAGLFSLPSLAKPAAEHPVQQKSIQNALADLWKSKEFIDAESPAGLLLVIFIVSCGLILIAR